MKKSCRLFLVMATCLFVLFSLQYEAGAQSKDSRFEIIGGDIVLDHSTGLMWAVKDNDKDINWQDAKSFCENFKAGGHTDWRLPTLVELDTIFDQESTKRFKAFSPIELTGCCPWTSDTRRTRARAIFFMTGEINTFDKTTTSSMRVLPVRVAR